MARQGSKIAVEILQSVNNRTQSLRKILRMVTRHPAGMHCPARDDAFVSSYRQDCRRVAANCRYCFYSQAKIRFFAPQGRLAAPIRILQDRRAPGPVCFLFVCWSRSESGAPCVRGLHSSNKRCRLLPDFDAVCSVFFGRDCTFRQAT